jgi:hypothetical protein
MYRMIAHFLQKSGFLTAFIELSDICARSVISHSVYLDKRPRVNPIELGIPVATLLLALQYGAFLRGEITIQKMRWRWLIGTVFFGALFFVATPSFLDRVNWNDFDHAFGWPVSWGYVLEGIGVFYPYVLVYWMPFAALVSLSGFVASFAPSDPNEEPAEQAGTSNGG